MPSVSEKQRKMMAIAEHAPGKLFARNKGALTMSHGQLHDFAVKPKSYMPKGATMSPKGDLGQYRAEEVGGAFPRPIKAAGRGNLKSFPYRRPETAKDSKLSLAGDEVA